VSNDHWEIVAVQNRYAEACDTRNFDLFESVFTEDALTEYVTQERMGRAERIASIRSHLGGCGPTQHLLGNYDVEVDGDEARASCYVAATHVGKERPDLTYDMFGIYRDRLVRTPQGWRIAHRSLEIFHERGTREVLQPG
jgi:3-phenylpropionate/cinnamic acid dioxygenase small subunit